MKELDAANALAVARDDGAKPGVVKTRELRLLHIHRAQPVERCKVREETARNRARVLSPAREGALGLGAIRAGEEEERDPELRMGPDHGPPRGGLGAGGGCERALWASKERVVVGRRRFGSQRAD